MTELNRWLAEWQQPGTVWYIRRLTVRRVLSSSAERNEWLLPAHIMARAFPKLYMVRVGHADIRFDLYIGSHAERRVVGIEGMKGKLCGSPSRRVCLMDLTGTPSPLLDPENVGAVTLLGFPPGEPKGPKFGTRRNAMEGRVWITRTGDEEEVVESYIGPVDGRPPVTWRIRKKGYENMDAFLLSMARLHTGGGDVENELPFE